jgi:IS1 family transposase
LGLCKKKKNFSREEIGTKWIWTALDTTTRLIVCYLIGDRTLEDARLFLRDLTSRTQQLPLFTSDELPHYADGLKELFHKSVKPKPTGRRGRPRKPEKIVDKSLDYAMVHKMWPCGESRGSGSFRLGRTYRRQAGTIAKQDDQHVLREEKLQGRILIINYCAYATGVGDRCSRVGKTIWGERGLREGDVLTASGWEL